MALAAILAAGAVFFFISKSATMSVGTILPEESVSSSAQVSVAASTSSPVVPPAHDNAPYVTICGTDIMVELATSTAAVQKGLSGRLSLAPDNGMLFIFAKPAIYRFWMPDMYFPLDMIWIDNGRVVDISKNVTTTFNPASPIFYTPKVPAEDVLEVNAGFSDAHGIEPGDAVTFENIE